MGHVVSQLLLEPLQPLLAVKTECGTFQERLHGHVVAEPENLPVLHDAAGALSILPSLENLRCMIFAFEAKAIFPINYQKSDVVTHAV